MLRLCMRALPHGPRVGLINSLHISHTGATQWQRVATITRMLRIQWIVHSKAMETGA